MKEKPPKLWHIPEDSQKSAVDFNNEPVTENVWQNIFTKQLAENMSVVNDFNSESKESQNFTDELLDLKSRFDKGERTQQLWNDFMNLL